MEATSSVPFYQFDCTSSIEDSLTFLHSLPTAVTVSDLFTVDMYKSISIALLYLVLSCSGLLVPLSVKKLVSVGVAMSLTLSV